MLFIIGIEIHSFLWRYADTFVPHNHSNSYGLKSWEETPIDIVEDDGCSSMPTVEGFYSLRSPDAIKLVSVGEEMYIITANEVSCMQPAAQFLFS
jgi:hypothetical protein